MKKNPTDRLTNESLLKRFKSQFDLVRYAIGIATDVTLSGRESGKFHSHNLASDILTDIAAGREVPGEDDKDEE